MYSGVNRTIMLDIENLRSFEYTQDICRRNLDIERPTYTNLTKMRMNNSSSPQNDELTNYASTLTQFPQIFDEKKIFFDENVEKIVKF